MDFLGRLKNAQATDAIREEARPGQDDEVTETLLEKGHIAHLPARSGLWNFGNIHLALLYVLVLILSVRVIYLNSKDASQLVYSPASEAVEYEVVDFGEYFINASPYMGYPNAERNGRWEELYNLDSATVISLSEAQKLANKTAKRPGAEGEYLIELDVFHQLHCLNDLRKALYPDAFPGRWEYNEDGTINYDALRFTHWEHCLDALRQTLMCHGDISPLPWHINRFNGNLAPKLATRHTCRNFDKIRDWARQRRSPDFTIHQVDVSPEETQEEIRKFWEEHADLNS